MDIKCIEKKNIFMEYSLLKLEWLVCGDVLIAKSIQSCYGVSLKRIAKIPFFKRNW